MAKTPFGTKLIYKIDGECIWSEYLSRSTPVAETVTLSFRKRAGSVFGHIRKGVQHALFLKAS
jgi:hypothetical protein